MATLDAVVAAIEALTTETKKARRGDTGRARPGSGGSLDPTAARTAAEVAILEAEAAAAKSLADDYERAASSAQNRVLAQEASIKATKQQLQAEFERAKLNGESLERLMEMKKEHEDILRVEQDQLTALEKMEENTEKFNRKLLKAKGYMQAMKKDSVGFTDAFIVTPALNKFVGIMKDVAFGLDTATHAFERTTGLNESFSSGITETYKDLREYGVSVEDAASAHTQLTRTMTDFTMLNKSERKNLAATGAILQELGVSAESFAKGTQAATKFFGQSAGDAGRTMLELKETAKALGVSPGLLADQFASAGTQFAKFGTEGVQAFKDLARVSKITGMEMEKILQVTNKFDTFEQAAEQAGKLNAALGTNTVNAMDLLMETDPAERFQTIRDAILDTGLTFDEMSYYQKQFYTEAAGLSEVGDLALMLGNNMDMLSGASQQSQADFEKAAEQAKQVQSIQEKFNATMAAAAPVLSELIGYLHGFFEILEKNEWIIKMLVPALMAYKVAATAIAMANNLKLAVSWMNVNRAMTGVIGAIALLVWWLFQKEVSSNFVEGLGKLAVVLGGLAIGWGLVSGALNLSTAALKRFTLAMMANPIGLVLVGITGGIVLAVKNWDGFVGGVKKGVSIMMKPLRALWGMLKKIGDLWGAIKGAPGKLWGGVKSFGKALIPGLAEGGIVTQPTLSMVGEAGAEAVIPLDGTVLPVRVVGMDLKAAGASMLPAMMGLANPFSALLGGASALIGRGRGGGGDQPIVIQLDAKSTKDFLEGKAIAAVGKQASGNLLGTNAG